MPKKIFIFLKNCFLKKEKEKEEEYGTETLCGLSSLKYLLSGLTLNHSLDAGRLHFAQSYLGSLLLRVKTEEERK